MGSVERPDFSKYVLLVADWSVRADKRIVYQVDIADRHIRRIDNHPNAWTVEALCGRAHAIINHSEGAIRGCIIAIDVAVGIPSGLFAKWADQRNPVSGTGTLAAFLRNPPQGADWLQESAIADEWSWQRPYIRVPQGNGALTAFQEAAANDDIGLKRVVDHITNGKSPLILAGIPGTVGSGSREVLRELWNRSGDAEWQSQVAIWPFDGTLQECMDGSQKVVVAEIYPRSLYGHVLDDNGPVARRRQIVAKTNRAVRLAAIQRLRALQWHQQEATCIPLSEECLDEAVKNEDDFDAYFSALGLLRLICEGVSLEDTTLGEWEGRPIIDRIAEGGMLGLLSSQANNDESRFAGMADIRPRQEVVIAGQPAAPEVWTTQAILNTGHPAIVFSGLPPGTKAQKQAIGLKLDNGDKFRLVIGDHRMIWRAHHLAVEQLSDFDSLFDILSEAPGEHHRVTVVHQQ